MTEISDDDFDLDVLMRRIRRDVEKRRVAAGVVATPPQIASSPGTALQGAAVVGPAELKLQRFEEAAPPLEYKDRYRVEEFLRYHDQQFVRNAYRGILHREPDATGLSSFLEPLRRDKISKIEILGRIRFSAEGRAASIRVDGLATRFALRSARRVPIVGRAVAVVQYFVRLPELAASLDRFERAYFQRELQTRRQLDINGALVEHALSAIDRRATGRLDTMQDDSARLGARISAAEAAMQSSLVGIRQLVTEIAHRTGEEALIALTDRLAAKADSTDLQQLSAELAHKADAEQFTSLAKALAEYAESSARLAQLEALEERVSAKWRQIEFAIADLRDADKSLRGEVDLASRGDVRVPETFYKDLEDKFRGSRDDILERVKMYLPMIVEAEAGTEQRPVLDVGCGRGELLEALSTRGLVGQGVDVNAEMIAECGRRGLHVFPGRAVEYMRSRWASSVGAVTALHVVEHLPFHDVLALIDEALRVLCPGGILILETPNPENLQVGANTFYLDPTHRRPIPPALLQFVAESRGFADVEVLRLHPKSNDDLLAAGTAAGLEGLNALLFGPQDYALIARKARPAASD